jgi:hypothetical protein
MKKTRLSLYYLAGYLLVAGVALIFVPQFALKLLLSNGSYGDIFPRLTGILLLSLGILIVQFIRLRVEVMYSTTLIVRALILITLVGLYIISHDPFFLVLVGVVGLGFVLTGISYLQDRQSGAHS